jgi:hypothetical protein
MLPFGLFLLAVGALYLRPAEFVPALENAQIYEALMLAAMATAAGSMWAQLRAQALRARPVTVLVLGLLVAVPLSHLAHFAPGRAAACGFTFFKVFLLYLVLGANVRTVPRLGAFIRWLVLLICCQVGLGFLGYVGYLESESLQSYAQREYDRETGERLTLMRMCGVGIFNDPNELCLLLAVGVILALYLLGDKRSGLVRYVCAVPLVAFALAIPLTQSRGGLLAVLAGLSVLAFDRLGAKRGTLIMGVMLVGVLAVAGGRITRFEIDNSDDTSQHRVQLWSEGLVLLRSSPLFGIGFGTYADEVGFVAHNSFVHAYTELGFFGGSCFFGLFAYTVWVLHRLRRRLDPVRQPALHRLRPYLLATVVAMAAGLFSLSRVYSPPTILIFGLCAAYFNLAAPAAPRAVPPVTQRLVARLFLTSALCLFGLYVFTTVMVQRS